MFTLDPVSKTERDLAADGSADALDELFDDTDFDDALEDALEAAEAELPRDDDTAEATTVVEDDVFIEDDEATVEDVVDEDAERTDAATDDSVDEDEVATVEHEVIVEHDATVADDEATVEVDDDTDDTTSDEATVEVDNDTDDTSTDAATTVEDDVVDEFPEIVQATPDEPVDDDHEAEAFVEEEVEEELDADEVAEEILEELRRADIDGPQVEMAPQDDTTAARRRPRRAVDYDPAPVPIPARVPRVLARKPRVRKVTRVVRHVDPWSVFKIALVANLVLYVIVLTAGVLLWNVAHATGTVDNVERFFESFGWQSFEFNGGEIYHASWIAGLFAVIGLTGMAVLLATLFNLITDLVGGVRFTVLEEEVVETRTSPLRRFVVRRPEPDVPARLSDQSGAMVREAVVDDTSANQRPSR